MNDICDMTDKEWTPQEVKELAELAEQKGISKKKLAEEWLGQFRGFTCEACIADNHRREAAYWQELDRRAAIELEREIEYGYPEQ